MTRGIPQTKWLKYLIETLTLTCIVGLFCGVFVGLVRGWGFPPQSLFLTIKMGINGLLVNSFIFLFSYLLVFFGIHRAIRQANWACCLASAIAFLPFLLFWGYIINTRYIEGFFEPRAIIWNIIIGLGFIVLWFLVSLGLFFWTQSRLLRPLSVNIRSLALLLAIIGFLNIAGDFLQKSHISNRQEETIAAENSITHPGVEDKDSRSAIYEKGRNAQNASRFYRFDDRLGDAILAEASEPMLDENAINFEFDERDKESWRPIDRRYVSTSVEKGFLEIVTTDRVAGIENVNSLEMPAESISGILFRIKASKEDHLKFLWKRIGEEDFDEKRNIRVRIPEEDKFIVYKINTSNLRDWSGIIDALRLYPTDNATSRIELDYIRFLPDNSYFALQKIGVDKYEIDSQLRRVLYAHSPSSIKYKINVPPRSFLNFGVGVIDPNITTNFEVLLETNGIEEKIYTKRVSEKKWNDVSINMSEWQGKEVFITFRTSSKKAGSVAFWSNPLLWQSKERPNVIIYVIDCLRADHVGAYGYKRDTTPNIDSFASEGALFLNAYSQATWTKPSMTSLMSSQHVSAHKVDALGEHLPASTYTIADVMRNEGYHTVSITDNFHGGVITNLDQGFERVFLKGLSGKSDRRDKSIDSVMTWLNDNAINTDRNFFLYLHSNELHGPYVPPKPYDTLYAADHQRRLSAIDYGDLLNGEIARMYKKGEVDERDINYIIALYDGLTNFADERFGRLIEILKDRGLFNNTLVILTADHGEAFNEHGQWTHGGYPYQELIRVPLIMRFPLLIPAGRVISEDAQLIDIAPTVLDLTGVQSNEVFQGISLQPLIRNTRIDVFQKRNVYSEGKGAVALIRGRDKFIMKQPLNSNVNIIKRIFNHYVLEYLDFMRIPYEFYDLKDDPSEKHNVFLREIIKSDLRGNVTEWLEVQNRIYKGEAKLESTAIRIVDPKVSEELKALGYID